ncbi:MAG: flagellar export chaperone FliS [Pseudomonadota bacterium]
MFASAAYASAPRQQAGAYQQMHLSTGVEGASSHALVAMLFDGALEAIAEARVALRSGNRQAKGNAICRAAGIVDEGLNARLDLAAGGAIAADLRVLYDYISARLVLANLRDDDAALEECARLLSPVRGAWADIADRAND